MFTLFAEESIDGDYLVNVLCSSYNRLIEVKFLVLLDLGVGV